MLLWHRLKTLWRNFSRRQRIEKDLDDELHSYLGMLEDEKARGGANLQNARRESLLELGGVEQAPAVPGRLTLHEARDRFERDLIVRTLAEQQGNISQTAELLGVERSNLYRKMKAFGIAPRRGEDEPAQTEN